VHRDHGHDFAGRRVAVIGTGASAIQFVPPVAEQAESLARDNVEVRTDGVSRITEHGVRPGRGRPGDRAPG
jgi:cation diffusion facilitator CzcD-associated flavoprotein CzcO